MYQRLQVILLIVCIAPSPRAAADGFKLSLQGNKIIAKNTEAFTPDYVFGHALDFINNIDGTFETSHGSVDANDPGSGFNFGGVGQSDSFKYNIMAIWTYDGFGAIPIKSGATLTLLKASTGDLLSQIDGQIAEPKSFAIAANNTHELIWSVPQSTTIQVWGLVYTVTGTSVLSGIPYEQSDPIVAVQWTPDLQFGGEEIMQIVYKAATGGDFDLNRSVDGADILMWQRALGSTEVLAADASGNGVVDAPDLFSWQTNYGRTPPASTFAPIPEPRAKAYYGPLVVLSVALRRRAGRERARKSARSPRFSAVLPPPLQLQLHRAVSHALSHGTQPEPSPILREINPLPQISEHSTFSGYSCDSVLSLNFRAIPPLSLRWSLVAGGLLATTVARGASYSEFVSGDLTSNGAAPVTLALDPGSNVIVAESSGVDFDILKIVVPANQTLDAIIVAFHDDPNRVFLGMQSGSTWTAGTGSGIDPSVMLGWVDFPSDPHTTHTGEDILDDISFAPGSIGFTTPLPSGSYTLLFQTPSSAIRFALDLTVSGVGGAALAGDFNKDQWVTAADLPLWKGAYNQSNVGDADGDNDTDGADLLLWQGNLGTGPGLAAAPEPGTIVLGSVVLPFLTQMRLWRKPRRRGGRRRQNVGITLVELLVVIAIIAVMAGLLIPAVQAAREAARKQQCGNNLKQIGLALHAHVAAQKDYPVGYVSELKPNRDDAGPGWAWGVRLLPYLEQTPLHEQVDFSKKIESPAMEAVRMTSLPVFICPSDDQFESIIDIRLNALFKPTCQMAAASYVGSAGTVRPTCIVCRDNFDGIFGRNRAVSPKELTDGSSNTLAVGERANQWASAVMWGVVAGSRLFDHQRTDKYAGGPGYVLGTTFKDGFNICESLEHDPNSSTSYAESFGSVHLGGCHFAFCDGGVRFIFDTIDPAVMNALATRDEQTKDGKMDPVIHESPF
jgi:type II secretory pathway pseudopilin PulG